MTLSIALGSLFGAFVGTVLGNLICTWSNKNPTRSR